MVNVLCNPFRVDVHFFSLTQGGARRLRRFADPGLRCLDPVGVVGVHPQQMLGAFVMPPTLLLVPNAARRLGGSLALPFSAELRLGVAAGL